MLLLQPLLGEGLLHVPARGGRARTEARSLGPVQLLLLAGAAAMPTGHLGLRDRTQRPRHQNQNMAGPSTMVGDEHGGLFNPNKRFWISDVGTFFL